MSLQNCTIVHEELQPWVSKTEHTLNCDIRVVFKEVWGGGEGSTPHPMDKETPPETSPFLHSQPSGEGLRQQ